MAEPLDPFLVEDRLGLVVPMRKGVGVVDAVSLSSARVDPAEFQKDRLRQKIYMSRYARIDVWSWEGRDVVDVREHFDAVVELVSRENAASRAREQS